MLVLAVATLTLTGLDPSADDPQYGSGVAIVLIYAAVGVVVARRQPRNPIGWILLIFTLLYMLGAGAVTTRCSPTASATGGCRSLR